ncbi:heavy-metal-associated domain-containing protein [Nodosilinea sp. P-1105]|uniref:heavy-metal-associated domain-containing protein n=1 Tax=Nodosilinea sp. P-1105 TaxID=2546229 RepID=UPI00146AC5E9|nr:heavy-metal-associated domain-containing protein [Nodosilinea sp. P-1105]NMF83349.1 copper chaperone [Nodosilinea sp. P-1105]
MTTVNLTVPDMACGACVDTITKAIKTLDPTAKIDTNLESKAVQIEASINESSITEAIEQAGYIVKA